MATRRAAQPKSVFLYSTCFFISKQSGQKVLIEEPESHVVILLLFALLLLGLFLLLLRWSSTASGGSSASGSGSGAGTGPDTGDEALDVARLESLGEETGPVGLDIHTSSLENGGDLLRCYGDIVVSQDEGGVDTGEFRVGHFKFLLVGFSASRDIALAQK